ncbi:MAG TPA: sigma-54 dependent transcriptional regulator [Syntrophales bacterium]|nr:sigma-54-dependent Fis family transcriptional regulator [Syntrophobacterales bacterium]HRT69914.1 sigma-54 dependent transcriptional regulator [Syntrophales bacterium]
MKKPSILIADDNNVSRDNLFVLLSENGFNVRAVEDGQQAIDAFLGEKFDLVITDLKMPRVDGLQLLEFIKGVNPESVVVMVTGHGTVGTAVEAMKLGAFDYVTKPLKDDLVMLTVERALSFAKLREENATLKSHLKKQYGFGKMIGYSDAMKRVFETIEKVASSDSTVIIYGESGTGKELVAKAIHFNSDRSGFPLVAVNCGAIPEDLLESELFGHEKGAFTGATQSRVGRFELAAGGTIFLDEIAEMSPALQVKLLRVIQEREFERIGGVRTISVDVRIIAATNQDLEKAVKERRFREDLYYRINVIPIHLPPLRGRKADISILANHFLSKFNKAKKKNIGRILPEAMAYLERYPWPGNVRELENLIEMLVVMKETGDIAAADLPAKILNARGKENAAPPESIPDEGVDFNSLVTGFEKDLLLRALSKTGGAKKSAAKLLNLNRTTFVEKLKRLNIS